MLVFALGFLAQGLFFLRIIAQWALSERAKKVLSPSIYWILSIIASWLFFIYGWLRNDFAILLGQLVAYYIYIWNLDKNGVWRKLPGIVKAIAIFTPIVVLLLISKNAGYFWSRFFADDSIPGWLIVFGSVGQIVFASRFIYQFIYSYRKNESLLPKGFWLISLIGSLLIVTYGIIRLDPVLVIGQLLGSLAYVRNLMIHRAEIRATEE